MNLLGHQPARRVHLGLQVRAERAVDVVAVELFELPLLLVHLLGAGESDQEVDVVPQGQRGEGARTRAQAVYPGVLREQGIGRRVRRHAHGAGAIPPGGASALYDPQAGVGLALAHDGMVEHPVAVEKDRARAHRAADRR